MNQIAGTIGTDKPRKPRTRNTLAHQLAKLDQQMKRALSAEARARGTYARLAEKRDAIIREAKAIAETAQ